MAFFSEDPGKLQRQDQLYNFGMASSYLSDQSMQRGIGFFQKMMAPYVNEAMANFNRQAQQAGRGAMAMQRRLLGSGGRDLYGGFQAGAQLQGADLRMRAAMDAIDRGTSRQMSMFNMWAGAPLAGYTGQGGIGKLAEFGNLVGSMGSSFSGMKLPNVFGSSPAQPAQSVPGTAPFYGPQEQWHPPMAYA